MITSLCSQIPRFHSHIFRKCWCQDRTFAISSVQRKYQTTIHWNGEKVPNPLNTNIEFWVDRLTITTKNATVNISCVRSSSACDFQMVR